MNTRLMPRTEFLVYNKISLSPSDREMLSDIYMPLIGPVSLSIYNYLIDLKQDMTVRFHSEFMDILNIELSTFTKELEKLEAIDLVKTYVNDDVHTDQFLYELKSPLDAESFFNDPMLSMFLFAKIGSKKFNEKKSAWIYHPFPEGFSDVSRNFKEVFSTLRMNEFEKPTETFIGNAQSEGSRIDVTEFDFDMLYTHLRGTYVEKGFFNTEVQRTIVKLSQVFNLSLYQMKDVIIKSTDRNEGIDLELLKHYALREYNATEGKAKPRVQLETLNTHENSTDYFEQLDGISPLNRIQHLRNNHASQNDMRIVTELIMTTKLSDGVINVLLEYVLQKGQYLNDNYVFSIARDWEKKGFLTAKEASESVLSFLGENSKAKKNYPNNRFKVSHKTIEPKWFSDKKTTDTKDENKNDEKTIPELKDDSIAARIQQFRNNR
ncbi:replication initiation and membrane attachment family protein [Phocicoccus pinnipedialis]|uniref:Replication initiation and membrane attachment protein n=1 Tax=Phocicoccus pinnipedialis TaxID=110845 RepID=A0A6V7RE22_9BACL|nr:DnaD domain protein [Jeotgalicoccus pinnipedialis]MBP1939482.1 replication initiation and membrane attachment protein [Jeotgalicoccus pinnipedialis]CAD2075209.1 Replication initiation and membrane attachment protein [Jeotgalicoccus pinnipedialis]